MADFLEEMRDRIHSRMKELKPAVDEYRQLQDTADKALGGVSE